MTERAAGIAPLGLAQDWWFEYGLRDPIYAASDAGIVRSYRMRGELDEDALRLAMTTIVRRHGVLRTRFVRRDQIYQYVESPRDAEMSVIDLRDEPESTRDSLAGSLLGRECERDFDLQVGPPYRLFLLRLTDFESVLAFHVHSIVFDGWSTSIFFSELAVAYNAACRDVDPSLPEIVEDYAAYAVWEQTQADQNLSYWRRQLQDLPKPRLFATLTTETQPGDYVAASHASWWSSELAEAIRSMAGAERTGVATLLLAAYAAFLARRTGQRDIAIVTLLACRPRAHLEHVIGRFANAVPLRLEVGEKVTARELVAQTRRRVFDAIKHQPVSGAELARLAQGAPTLAFFNYPRAAFELAGLEIEPFPINGREVRVELPEGATAPDDIDLMFREKGSRAGLEVAYDATRVSQREIASFLEELEEFLAVFSATAAAYDGVRGEC